MSNEPSELAKAIYNLAVSTKLELIERITDLTDKLAKAEALIKAEKPFVRIVPARRDRYWNEYLQAKAAYYEASK